MQEHNKFVMFREVTNRADFHSKDIRHHRDDCVMPGIHSGRNPQKGRNSPFGPVPIEHRTVPDAFDLTSVEWVLPSTP